MQPYVTIVALSWMVFLAVWFVTAMNAKKNLGSTSLRFGWVRVFGLIFIVLILTSPALQHYVAMRFTDPIINSVGAVCAVFGIAFAIWARVYLGTNWGMPMSVKEKPELVTTGPYAYVRHPIYTGVILAMIGTALVTGIVWVMPILLFVGYFVYSAKQEEKMLSQEFPDTYPAYMHRSKMLIPFIF